jgi:3-hydroxyacyl-[acyl-carrier-protein] dehydratase
MRFELLDRVVEESAERVVAVKCVTAAEEYLADHFPGFPILPGVMMLEALVQAGRRLAALQEPPATPGVWVVSEARKLTYAAMVKPGETLTVEVRRRGQPTDGTLDCEGVGRVGDREAVKGRFRLRRV